MIFTHLFVSILHIKGNYMSCIQTSNHKLNTNRTPDLNSCENFFTELLNHTSLNLRFNVNKTDHEGNTALHLAARTNQKIGTIALLLTHANVSLLNHSHKTPLDIAKETHREEVALYLSSKVSFREQGGLIESYFETADKTIKIHLLAQKSLVDDTKQILSLSLQKNSTFVSYRDSSPPMFIFLNEILRLAIQRTH